MNQWPKDEVAAFQASIEKLRKAGEKKKEKTGGGRTKRDEEVRFLRNLTVRLQEIEDRGVTLRTDVKGAVMNLLAVDMEAETIEQALHRWNELQVFIINLNTIKAMAQFEQGRIITRLSRNKGEQELALAFTITQRKVKDFLAFFQLCCKYPCLFFTGYTMSTLLRHKRLIDTVAGEDEDFLNRLQIIQDVIELEDSDGQREEKNVQVWFEDPFFDAVDDPAAIAAVDGGMD